MKIALLMTGLLRHHEVALNRFKTLRDDFFYNIQIDVFFVTSDRVGNVNTESKISRHTDMSQLVSADVMNRVLDIIKPTDYLIASYEDEIKYTEPHTDFINALFKDHANRVASRIPNVLGRWYLIVRGLNHFDFSNYDVLVCCRMDCKFIPKFDQEQLVNAKVFHTLSQLWCAEHSFGRNCEKSEELSQRLSQQTGYAADFFYGPPSEMLKFKEIYDHMHKLNPSAGQLFHDKAIYTNYIKKSMNVIELIRWSKDLNERDFLSPKIEFTNVGHTYPPNMVVTYLARLLG